ncbi:MAG TPA: metalloregulator ArsR/SmtB family transcription factor [Microthrixaceae bacterium]|nr:metalloregulator ArsR/SmtB family transcription factor [Microthrixaceae bacterium]
MTSDETIDCCPQLLTAPLAEAEADELAAAFRALADPVRLRLLSLIANAPDGTACSCDLEEPVGKSQSTVSHHLSLLADAGLITKERVGRWVNCTIVPERLAALCDALAGSSAQVPQ